jgi:hypothetical protein
VLTGTRVSGSAVRKVDGVQGSDLEGLGVVIDGGRVILLLHGGVSLSLE